MQKVLMATVRSFCPRQYFESDLLATLRHCDSFLGTSFIYRVLSELSHDPQGLFVNHLYEDKAFVDFVTASAARMYHVKKSELVTIQETILLKFGYQKEQIEKQRKKAACFIL